jgi:hypothetical protein
MRFWRFVLPLLASTLATGCAGAPPRAASVAAAPAPRLAADAAVYGLVLGDAAKAYPFDKLAPLTQDTVGGKAVILITDTAHRVVRAAERGDRTFSGGRVAFGNNFLVDQEGHPWKLTAKSLEGPDGKSFPVLSGELTTWAAWSKAHPGSLIYQPSQPR